jgi:hypothetical protein
MRWPSPALVALLVLTGCGAETVWAPDAAVSRAAHAHDGPPRLTLFTMVNNATGAGAHTALMINGAQRVIFDPAGSFRHPSTPERNDLLYGITPRMADLYTRYHARRTFHVQILRLDVAPETADRALRLAAEAGPVPQARCSLAASRILAALFPGRMRPSWFPLKTAAAFARIDGVTGEKLYEYDGDTNANLLAEWDPARAAAQ